MNDERRFAFRLALALGIPNPDFLLETLPHRIYREWQQYYETDPFGLERGDIQAALIASTIANLLGRKKGKPPFSIKQFTLSFEPKKPKTPENLLQKIMSLNALLGGTVEQ